MASLLIVIRFVYAVKSVEYDGPFIYLFSDLACHALRFFNLPILVGRMDRGYRVA